MTNELADAYRRVRCQFGRHDMQPIGRLHTSEGISTFDACARCGFHVIPSADSMPASYWIEVTHA